MNPFTSPTFVRPSLKSAAIPIRPAEEIRAVITAPPVAASAAAITTAKEVTASRSVTQVLESDAVTITTPKEIHSMTKLPPGLDPAALTVTTTQEVHTTTDFLGVSSLPLVPMQQPSDQSLLYRKTMATPFTRSQECSKPKASHLRQGPGPAISHSKTASRVTSSYKQQTPNVHNNHQSRTFGRRQVATRSYISTTVASHSPGVIELQRQNQDLANRNQYLEEQLRNFKSTIAAAVVLEPEQTDYLDSLKRVNEEASREWWMGFMKDHETNGTNFLDILWEETELLREAKKSRQEFRRAPEKAEYEQEKAWQDDVRAYMRGWSEGYNASPTESNKARIEEEIRQLRETEAVHLQNIQQLNIEANRLEAKNAEKVVTCSTNALVFTSIPPS